MYPADLVMPMKAELTNEGFEEMLSADEVEQHLTDHHGTTMVVINSVCGCAAGAARPGVIHSLRVSEKKPDHLKTVFAGFDMEAVQKVRQMHMPFPPSSPSIAFYKDGELVHFIERHHIEGRNAQMISNHLQEVYKEFC